MIRRSLWSTVFVAMLGCGGGGSSGDDAGSNGNVNSVCGNGQVEGGEQCDEGAANSDTAADACRSNCRPASCGDGVVDTGELCDDANEANGDGCLTACAGDDDCCRPNRCGDGYVNATMDASSGYPVEACDNGVNSGAECRPDCGQLMTDCGDGVRDQGEECDAAGGNSDTAPDACRSNCQGARCGDDVMDSDEDCDGTDLGDAACPDAGVFTGGELACAADCSFDTGACELVPACGDGACHPGETLFNCYLDCQGDVTCAEAEALETQFGCDFWAVTTSNAQLDMTNVTWEFTLLVYNPNSTVATVEISRAGAQVALETVPGGQYIQVDLPYVDALRNEMGLMSDHYASVLETEGAYHVTSSLPVTAFQFNPYEYLSGTSDYSYSNDGSLLLPTHTLTGSYVVMARQTVGQKFAAASSWSFKPGFLAVAGTAPGTSVELTFSAHTLAGASGLSAYGPGDTATFSLGVGDVLQILSGWPADCAAGVVMDPMFGPQGAGAAACDLGASYDLTGTRIAASAPVAVFSGHDCALVPTDTIACDHVEQQLMPLETWGREFLVVRPEPQAIAPMPDEPNLVRVLSATDGNLVTFDPPQATVGAQVTLSAGEHVEFQATGDFTVSGVSPLLVGQFLVGGSRITDQAFPQPADPSFSLVVPVEQYRRYYAFMVPSTFTSGYISVAKPVVPTSAPLYLDGVQIPNIQFSGPIGTSDYGRVRVPVGPGGHIIESPAPFALQVYGFANYTSYMYPGGMNLTHLP